MDSDDDKPSELGSGTFDALLREVARSEARSPPTKDELPGTTLGHYAVASELGRGGMGVVYSAQDARLGRPVALKVLPAAVGGDDERRRRFLREARAAAAINHPNIATIYDVGEADGRLYFAMEYVEGRTLRARLGAGALDAAEATRIARQIALGLARAHEKGVVHRDLKPENVMLTPDGGVKILDFGLAKLREPASTDGAAAHPTTLTQEGRVMGTPGYMSPEQATGKRVDERTDVYALGIVLHEMLTGELPGAHGSGRVAPDAGLAAIVTRCLAPLPDRRWANAGEIVAALDALVPVARTSPDAPAARPGRGRRTPWVVAAGAVVIAGSVLAGGAIQRRRASSPAGATVAPGAAVPVADGCTSNRACVEEHGGGAWRCHGQRRTCVELGSEDCTVYAGAHDAEADDVVWLGGMFPLTSYPELVSEMRAAELARQDFAQVLGPGVARSGPLHARPIGLVVCDEGRDALRAARHLVDDVEVPAAIGFFSTPSALTTIPTVFLPGHVLSFVSLSQTPAITQIPEPPGEPRLVWRSTLNRSEYAAPVAHLISDVLEPAARQGPRGIGDRPFKVAAVLARGGNHDFIESVFGALRFNGRSALENGADFRQFVYASEGDDGGDGVIDGLLAFAPQVIVFSDPSFGARVLLPLEGRWSTGERPLYVTDEGLPPEVAAFAGRNPARRHRFFAVTNLSTTMTNAQLVLRYNLAFPSEPVVRSAAPQPSYDAFYALAYAIYALGAAPVSGPALSGAIRQLLPPGRVVEVGPGQILGAFETLRAGGHIDLNGAIGALDFDPATGEAPIDYAIVCPGIDDHGAASAPVDSGLTYDARAKKLVGALRCP